MREFERRRDLTTARISQLQGKLADASTLLSGVACVYSTGSFGRLEASEHSDLDLFIVAKSKLKDGEIILGESQLSRLDEICVKADLIEATRSLDIPDFDGDGRYLVQYPVSQIVATLGAPEDDVNNTFTARLLMLLESKPLLGDAMYFEAIDEIIAAYSGDYEDHRSDFSPAFLVNDILRLWRTFCVNYEARTERTPEEKRIKRKLKNYKLKHSRLLTCYSALVYMLVVFQRNQTVSPKDISDMVRLTPLERIHWLLKQNDTKMAWPALTQIVDQYDHFLEVTNEPEMMLIRKFADSQMKRKLTEEAYAFAETMFEVIGSIGNGSRLHRVIVV